MRLTATKADLVRALARVRGAADPKGSLPMLANILIVADGDGARVSATDLFVGASSAVPCEVEAQGAAALPAGTLWEAAKSLPEGEVALQVDGTSVKLTGGKTRFRIATAMAEDFPELPAPEGKPTNIEGSALLDAIAFARHAMATDQARPHLAGMLIECKSGTLRAVSTDGQRMALAERPSNAADFRAFVPLRAIDEPRRFLDGVTPGDTIDLARSKVALFFTRGADVLSTKLADDQFPPFARVIPTSQPKRVVAARDALLDAVKRARVMVGTTQGKDKAVKGHLVMRLEPGSLTVRAEKAGSGEAVDEISVDYAGEPLVIGCNDSFLSDALSALSHDEVALGFGSELDPITVRPVGGDGESVSVIMPVRM